MKFKFSTRMQDLTIELGIMFFVLIFILIFLLVGLVGFIYPFPSYKYFDAVVEYKNEIPIFAEQSGVITSVLVKAYDDVYANKPIVKLSNRENIKQSKILDYEVQRAEAELKKSQNLKKLGMVSPLVINQQEIAISRLKYQQEQYSTKLIRAPYNGKVYFNKSVEKLPGEFVMGGQKIGYICPSEQKIIKIETSSNDFLRFKDSTLIKIFTKDSDKKQENMAGLIYQKTVQRENGSLFIYGEISSNYEEFKKYEPGSLVKVAVLITKESLFEAFFDYDIYSKFIKNANLPLFNKISKFLEWVQK